MIKVLFFSFAIFCSKAEMAVKPKIMVLFIDDGSSEKLTNEAIKKLPKGCTVALSHNSKNLAEKAAKFKDRGIHVSLLMGFAHWGVSYGDSGKGCISPNNKTKENIENLDLSLEKISSVSSITIWNGGGFFKEEKKFELIANEIDKKGYIVLDPNQIGFKKFFKKKYIAASKCWEEDSKEEQISSFKVAYSEALISGKFFITGMLSYSSIDSIREWASKNKKLFDFISPNQYISLN